MEPWKWRLRGYQKGDFMVFHAFFKNDESKEAALTALYERDDIERVEIELLVNRPQHRN